jgi:hypothetical protein
LNRAASGDPLCTALSPYNGDRSTFPIFALGFCPPCQNPST